MNMKGDSVLNAIVLIVAGVAGTTTGLAVEQAALPTQIGAAIGVGLVVGGALYAAIRVFRKRRSP